MSFLHTEPAAIHPLDDPGGWDRFRVGDPHKRSLALKQLCRGDLPMTLGLPGGATVATSLWAVDDAQRQLLFNVEADARTTATMQALHAEPEVWAVAYPDQSKLQFLLQPLTMRVRSGRLQINCRGPLDMYLLPRRGTVRVRRPLALAPLACFSAEPAGAVPPSSRRYVVINLSLTGLALLQPPGGVPLQPGDVIQDVTLDLDEDTQIRADMTVQHVTCEGEVEPRRVGCAWQPMPEAALETLRRWIARGRMRHDVMTLKFD